MSNPTLGQKNYAGYCARSRTKTTHDGRPLPTWEELDGEIRAQWQAGAEAVLEEHDGASLMPSTGPVPTGSVPAGNPP
jgi:hypothetical protein